MVNQIDGAKYIAFSSLKTDGTPVSTAVWVVPFDDGYGFTTGASAYKVGRIKRNPAITVAVCDRSGKVMDGATIYCGMAHVLDSNSSEQVARAIRSKYFVLGRLLQFYSVVIGVIKPSRRIGETAIKFVIDN